jgi:hypothetical protein
MKLPIFKRVNREQFPDDVSWIGNLLYPLNNFFETVYNIFNKNLTFEDNFQSFTKNLQFSTNSSYTTGIWDVISIAIPDTFKNRVSGVIMLQFGPQDTSLTADIQGIYLSWVEDNGQLQINWIGGLADSTIYNMRILVV